MNKRTFSNLMSIEKKAFDRNVTKYRELLAADADATPSKRGRTSIESKIINVPEKHAATSIEDDPLNTSATFGLVINPQRIEMVANKDPQNANAEIISLLKAILDQQNNLAISITNLDNRLDGFETCIEDLVTSSKENLKDKPVVMAQNKVMCECKVLIQKVHKSICRMTGDDIDGPQADIATTLPLHTTESAAEVEVKLANKEYLKAMKLYLLGLKTSTRDIDDVIRRMYTDDFLILFNWDGRKGKLALQEYTLVTDVLYGIFNFNERKSFESAMRRSIERSHRRIQKRHRDKNLN